jgi:raffinose/stachyose/melibiose transport system substrate-binding protein
MKKCISLLLCAALILTGIAGCSREKTEMTEPTQAPTIGVEQMELTKPSDERPYVGLELQFATLLEERDPRAEVIRQAAEVFEKRTGAVVHPLWLGSEEALAECFVGCVKMDIFASSVDTLETMFAPYGLDLTQMAAESGYEQHSHPALREQVVDRCGYLAAIPQSPILYGMYYNQDTVGALELPTTWAEALDFSAKLTMNGFMPMAMDIENSNLALELYLERQLGYETFRQTMAQAGWTVDTARIELFRLPIDYADAGYLAKGDPAIFPGGQDKLALSNVAMVPGSSELCAQVENSTLMDVNWGVFPFPGDGEGKGFAVESQVLAVHKDCANPQAAFDFIMLLTTGAFDQLYADAGVGIPADPVNACVIEGAMELLEKADKGGFGLLRSADNELFSRLWNGWYKTPGYFASAMNGLAGAYAPVPTEGVG